MPDFTAVGFDLDGTLFDHQGAATDAVDAFVRQLGRQPSQHLRGRWLAAENRHFEEWRAGRITFQEQRRRRLREFLPAVGVTTPNRDDEIDGLFQTYVLAYRHAWRAYPDARPLLAALREQGVTTGILTNGNHEQQLDKVATIGLADLVNVVCTSEQIGFPKPDLRAFAELAAQLGARPDQLVFLGDNAEHDVVGARAAGMRAGLVTRASTPEVNLRTALENAR